MKIEKKCNRKMRKEPIKEQMGRWDFIKEEFRERPNGTRYTMWLVECECKREGSMAWKMPYNINSRSMCDLCHEENKIDRRYTKKLERPIVEEAKPMQAPVGQMSLAPVMKEGFEKAPEHVKSLVNDACDKINDAYKAGESRMKLYMYSFCSLDYDWARLPTVKEHLEATLFKDQLSTMDLTTRDGDFYKTLYLGLETAQFVAAALNSCLEYAENNMHWDNTFCEEPRIFFIPAVGLTYGFSFGFVWKMKSDGLAYIASPLEMPQIEDDYDCVTGIVHI